MTPAARRLTLFAVLAALATGAESASARMPAEAAAPPGVSSAGGWREPDEAPPPNVGQDPAIAVVEDGGRYSFDPRAALRVDERRFVVVAATAPDHGSVWIEGGARLTYVPTPGYHGLDRFSFTLSDNDGTQVVSSVAVRVVAARLSMRGYSEVVPRAFTASSNYAGYTGLTAPGGMRDSVYNTADSFHGTQSGGDQWVMAMLDRPERVTRIVLVCAASSAPGGWGCNYLNGARVQVSGEGRGWRTIATVSGIHEDQETPIDVDAGEVSRVRLVMSGQYLAIGDFRLFTREDDRE